MPVAWMLTSNMTTEIITFFVKWVRDASPSVQPAVIMTDCDQAQIAALKITFPQSQILLCTWAWVRTDDIGQFYNIWDKISSDPLVPESVVKYLKTKWLPVLHRWSMIGRKH